MARPLLHDSPGVHDADPIAQRTDDAEVVGNEQHRSIGLLAQYAHEVEDFGFDRGVEASGRLIEHQQLWVAGKRHGDHDALLHTSGQLERIAIHHAHGVGNAYPSQRLKRRFLSISFGLAKQREALDQLATDLHRGIHRLCRVLIDHRRFSGSKVLQLRGRHASDIVTGNKHATGHDLAVARQVAQGRVRGGGLSTTALAHKAIRLAGRNAERHAAKYRSVDATHRVDHLEVFNGERGCGVGSCAGG